MKKLKLTTQNKDAVTHLEGIADNIGNGIANFLIEKCLSTANEAVQKLPPSVRKHIIDNIQIEIGYKNDKQ